MKYKGYRNSFSFWQKVMAKQIWSSWRTSSQGHRSCGADKFEDGSTSWILSRVHSGALGGTVPALVTFPAAGQGSRRRAQLVCVVSSHKRQPDAGSSTGHYWLTHLALHFFFPWEYEGAVDFTGSTFLWARWGREWELVGKEITGGTQHWKSWRQS